MHVLITGGTGFIGRHLCKALSGSTQISVLSRKNERQVKKICGNHVIALSSLSHINPAARVDAIINLAGEPIADARWTSQRKQQLLDSRCKTTRDIVTLISDLEHKPKVFISGSAVGYYGDQGQESVIETTAPHPEFTHDLCASWEACAQLAEPFTRVCYLRTGLVVGKSGGFLKKMLLPFKLGLGTTLGKGDQYMPWIHLDDMVAIILFLLHNEDCVGPFNACAPEPVTNRDFTKTLANTLNRPAFLTTPAPVLKLALGELSRLLLTGQRAIPKRLSDNGFSFQYSNLDAALENLVSSK